MRKCKILKAWTSLVFSWRIQTLLEYVVVFASNDQDVPFLFASNDQDMPFQVHSYIHFVVKNTHFLYILFVPTVSSWFHVYWRRDLFLTCACFKYWKKEYRLRTSSCPLHIKIFPEDQKGFLFIEITLYLFFFFFF